MKVEAIQNDEVLIVRAIGSLNASGTAEFARQLHDRCHPGLQTMILDFSGLDELGPPGLKALYILSKKARERSGRLVVVGLRPQVHEVFHSSGFVALYKILGSVDEALAAVR
ncbi:anti-anti-sigma regulatory factor (antagonist of anti-sigma factor) [Herbaspirillum sp. CF444]|uniref:STAS domain-containing protein n=1 Tax=Herbaspirillum sp. CF444 TaxID=1144319 RepID=UPI0002727E45|nr:STAS domain-containing protein [Herbaspirillum sp. CF444]EJL92316.1 anti-anti-sigma regulatory factor (antagonist of anti-sigma factor) [Herbaspirillum sp. CF444]